MSGGESYLRVEQPRCSFNGFKGPEYELNVGETLKVGQLMWMPKMHKNQPRWPTDI